MTFTSLQKYTFRSNYDNFQRTVGTHLRRLSFKPVHSISKLISFHNANIAKMLSSMHLNAMVLFKLSRTKDVQKYCLGKHLWGLFMVLPCRDYHKSSIMKTNLHSQHERKVVKVVKPVDARTKVVFKFTFFLFGDDHKSTSKTTNEPTNYLVTSRQPILTV